MTSLGLESALSFDSGSGGPSSCVPPAGTSLLITDTLECPATFLTTHLIKLALKGAQASTGLVGAPMSTAKARVIVLLTSQREEHYVAILRKMVNVHSTSKDIADKLPADQGVNTTSEKSKGRLTFIDGMRMTASDPSDALQSLYVALSSAIDPSASDDHTVVMLDDLTMLHWLGVDSYALIRFYRALITLTTVRRTGLVVILHSDNTAITTSNAVASDRFAREEDHLLRSLVYASHVWVRLRSLRTQSTGELIVQRCPALMQSHPQITSGSRTHALQYKIEDNGPRFFAKGTANGYL
ncbi:uncharacterized protein L969DRAFT_96914 [Mixia osmundae IAM 14324]|uniref:Elongator complex protein 6 n=1 Tax=Mixia osmundae (strain CBS 9802 / IAM 14324 / JCM 22182 / KY 12970) TaxID=764103 RepID=G7E2G7_MIXOS|nr:uncharacterized protein L969DRAFT_96914 [Mixia osmundae IAM 14324]KEI36898.1 hypothetical protein L969DRAFT_96914 [Mixia osmundae IAM 14324]GAA97027.1 hypothetical protein E5Q_03702 [Mixia osmundae IAM 14324]